MLLKFCSTAPLRQLKRAHFDVKSIVKNLPQHLASIKARQLATEDELVAQLHNLPAQQEDLRQLSTEKVEIQTLRKATERKIKQDASRDHELRDQLKSLKTEFQSTSEKHRQLQEVVYETCLSLPNLVEDSVPAEEPELVQWVNPLSMYRAEPARDHVQILVRKGLVDFKAGADITGSSWYYLLGDAALLEQALIAYATARARKQGFSMCIPPSIARCEIIDACGFRPRDMNNEQQIYHIADSQLGLTATAEIPLAGLAANRVLDLSSGPRKVCGVSRSYRAEAGARGKDTRGLYRVHEFTKVELFCWCTPEESTRILEELREFQTTIVSELGLPAKVLNMPANDLGAPAYKKYDVEAWMPGRGSFGEITSTSNCLDFQSRRMHTKFKTSPQEKPRYAHTLNGTAMAIPRVILAIVENFYNPGTDKIAIPLVLHPYMDNKTEI
ncbi:LAMI_0H02784g1_1 [Lachancea mirantina]|uniref:serine--tRNA ligase n=1 Tax=Lachancea mirantina TaxID=1230905 RepID=A0A1G4KE25_9SACH|nr:LAMI_0H02784g1_1 [Lachancea mirantina]